MPNAGNELTNRWTVAKGDTFYGYDVMGNLTNVDYPGTALDLSLQYDFLDRLTNTVDAVGTTAFTYDAAGSLLSEAGPWSQSTVSYAYSSRRRASATLGQPNASPWVQTYGYNDYNQLGTVTSPAGAFAHTWLYVGSDIRNTLQLPGPGGSYNTTIFDEHDHLGRITSRILYQDLYSGTVLHEHDYTYNDANQRTSATTTRNVERLQTPHSMNYTYDNIGQLQTARGLEADGTTPRLNEQFGYAYDAAWNLSRRTNNALVQSFGVNTLNELTNATRAGTLTVAGLASEEAYNATYGVPGINSVTVSGTGLSSGAALLYADGSWARTNATLADGANTYTATALDSRSRTATDTVSLNLPATNILAYDGNGNLTNDGWRSFEYDYENQLTNVFATNAWRSEFRYDAFGRRRVRREYTWNGAWALTNEVRYLYDGMVVLQERDANNLPQVTYTRGADLSGSLQGAGGIGGLLARSENAGMIGGYATAHLGSSPVFQTLYTHAYYFSDGNGNVTALVSTNKLVVAEYNYDPYGNLLGLAGPMADANTYRFSSKEFHGPSGVHYYGLRYYEPNLQRWLNRDPMGYIASLHELMEDVALRKERHHEVETLQAFVQVNRNLYGFAANSPINRIDFLGIYTSYSDCAIAAQVRYLGRSNDANWKVFKGHLVLGSIFAGGTVIGGAVALHTGFASTTADIVAIGSIVGEAVVFTHGTMERRKLEKESKDKLTSDLTACAKQFPPKVD